MALHIVSLAQRTAFIALELKFHNIVRFFTSKAMFSYQNTESVCSMAILVTNDESKQKNWTI